MTMSRQPQIRKLTFSDSPLNPQPNSSPAAPGPSARKRFFADLCSLPVGAGFSAIFFFFFIMFISDPLLANTDMTTLGITVAIGTVSLVALIVLTLFIKK